MRALRVGKPLQWEISVNDLNLIVREPRSPEEHRELMEVERLIWSTDYREVFPYHITIPLMDIGGIVLGVYDKSTGKPVGVMVMMPGIKNGKVFLYSHMFGLLKEYRGRGIGTALKRVQREAALIKGYDLITWTYDPLLSLNSWYNFVKAGVIARIYKVNYYGLVYFEYNRGVESDRLLAEWYLRSERVRLRLEKGFKPEPMEYFVSRGALTSLKSVEGVKGFRRPSNPVLSDESELVLIEVPDNFVEMQVKSPETAREWRVRVREAMTYYLSRGYLVFEFTRSSVNPRRYYYVLWRTDLENVLRGGYP